MVVVTKSPDLMLALNVGKACICWNFMFPFSTVHKVCKHGKILHFVLKYPVLLPKPQVYHIIMWIFQTMDIRVKALHGQVKFYHIRLGKNHVCMDPAMCMGIPTCSHRALFKLLEAQTLTQQKPQCMLTRGSINQSQATALKPSPLFTSCTGLRYLLNNTRCCGRMLWKKVIPLHSLSWRSQIHTKEFTLSLMTSISS